MNKRLCGFFKTTMVLCIIFFSNSSISDSFSYFIFSSEILAPNSKHCKSHTLLNSILVAVWKIGFMNFLFFLFLHILYSWYSEYISVKKPYLTVIVVKRDDLKILDQQPFCMKYIGKTLLFALNFVIKNELEKIWKIDQWYLYGY